MKFLKILHFLVKILALLLLLLGVVFKILHWEYGIFNGRTIMIMAVAVFVLGIILPNLFQKK